MKIFLDTEFTKSWFATRCSPTDNRMNCCRIILLYTCEDVSFSLLIKSCCPIARQDLRGNKNTGKKMSGVGGGESQMQKKQHGKSIGEVNEFWGST